jgi:hypothetical protein
MTRPALPDFVRLLLVGLGVFCLSISLLDLWEHYDWKTAPGVVEVYSTVEYGRTNTYTRVAYARDDGTKTVVMSSGMPMSARSGDHVTVLYDPDRIKASVVFSFDTFWSTPVYLAALGILLTLGGLIARSRRRVAFRGPLENAA